MWGVVVRASNARKTKEGMGIGKKGCGRPGKKKVTKRESLVG